MIVALSAIGLLLGGAGLLDVQPRARTEALVPVPPGFVKISAGRFTMGSPKNEPGRGGDEGQRAVRIERSFYLSTTEVSQGQWEALMGSTPSRFKSCGEACPVERVNWFEAAVYTNTLSRKSGLEICYELGDCTGTIGDGCRGDGLSCVGGFACDLVKVKGPGCGGYRLPTEAEWEYAARGGVSAATYAGSQGAIGALGVIGVFGANSSVKYAGANDCSGWAERDHASERCGPSKAKTKRANGWGLYDMLGNVWEWTDDQYGPYAEAPTNGSARVRAAEDRVFRGGGWASRRSYLRAAERGAGSPVFHVSDLGFRVARTVL